MRPRIGWGLAGLLMLSAGCASVREQAESIGSTLSGNLDTTLDVRPPDVINVAKDTCDDLRLVIVSTTAPTADDSATRIVAHNDRDERVMIAIRAAGASASRVTVGTGWFGDAVLRQRVMDVIKARLEAATDDDREDTATADADDGGRSSEY